MHWRYLFTASFTIIKSDTKHESKRVSAEGLEPCLTVVPAADRGQPADLVATSRRGSVRGVRVDPGSVQRLSDFESTGNLVRQESSVRWESNENRVGNRFLRYNLRSLVWVADSQSEGIGRFAPCEPVVDFKRPLRFQS